MTESKKTGTFRQSLLFSIGCGCVYPMVFLVIMIPVAFLLMADPVRQIVTTPAAPQISAPGQEHFWSLQEKILDLPQANSSAESPKPDLQLSHEEFNAWLSGLQYPPATGLVVHRIRFLHENGRGAFYLFCSGFFMRNLIITLQLDSASAPAVGDLLINSRLAISNSWLNRQVISMLSRIFSGRENDGMNRLIKGQGIWRFDDKTVTLSGDLF